MDVGNAEVAMPIWRSEGVWMLRDQESSCGELVKRDLRPL